MFCPRCGQKLASNAVRFCANCGLRLEAVTYLLANDGHLPGPMTPEPAVPSLKKQEMRRGAKLLFSSFISFPVFFALCFIPENPAPLLVPATLFVTGICWLLYARWFCDDKTPAPKKALPESLSQSVYSPFAQTHSASQLAPPIKTAEIEPPHSVIEHTTRQLIKE
jgi:hypothetical protein